MPCSIVWIVPQLPSNSSGPPLLVHVAAVPQRKGHSDEVYFNQMCSVEWLDEKWLLCQKTLSLPETLELINERLVFRGAESWNQAILFSLKSTWISQQGFNAIRCKTYFLANWCKANISMCPLAKLQERKSHGGLEMHFSFSESCV